MTPLDLLAIQHEGELDVHGHLRDVDGVTIAATADADALWIGAAVPADLAAALADRWARAPRAARPEEPPPALDACAALLGPRSLRMGPSYLFGDTLAPAPPAHVEADPAALHPLNPGNWHAVEWQELVDGALGPRAIATERGRVVSICHTPGPLTPRGAEAGVWTHRDARGRGLASATAAAWAALLRPTGRHLFYATDADNRSSQRVAARLGLTLLGWTWRYQRPRPGRALHPLCSLSGSGPARSS